MESNTRRTLFIIVPLLSFLLVSNNLAQAQSATPDSAAAKLAEQLFPRLKATRANRILVLDLRGPQNEYHPVGKWLADQLSLALQASSREFVLLDRTRINDQALAAAAAQRRPNESDNFMALARTIGADSVIQGSYAKYSQHLGISLSVTNPTGSGTSTTVKAALPINATLPISTAMAALSADPIPTFKNGILKNGVAGTPNPVCAYCPEPEYSDEARRAKYQGTVLLQVTINPQGSVDSAQILRGPGLGLEEKALEGVKRWQFKPPLDPEGNPAWVSVSVEVAFRLFRGPH